MASKLLAVLLVTVLGTILGLGLGLGMAAGLRAGSGPIPSAECASLPAADGGDQAHNPETPGQPPSRLLDTDLQKDGGDDGLELANLAGAPIGLCASGGRWLTFFERRNHAGQRAREGHGARGPPSA